MARENRRADQVRIGDKVFFPNSRRPATVINILQQDDGTIKLISDTARWMMAADFQVAVQIDEGQPKAGIRDL